MAIPILVDIVQTQLSIEARASTTPVSSVYTMGTWDFISTLPFEDPSLA